MGVLRIGVQVNVGPGESALLEPMAPPDIEEVDVLRKTDVHQYSNRYAEGGGRGTRLVPPESIVLGRRM